MKESSAKQARPRARRPRAGRRVEHVETHGAEEPTVSPTSTGAASWTSSASTARTARSWRRRAQLRHRHRRPGRRARLRGSGDPAHRHHLDGRELATAASTARESSTSAASTASTARSWPSRARWPPPASSASTRSASWPPSAQRPRAGHRGVDVHRVEAQLRQLCRRHRARPGRRARPPSVPGSGCSSSHQSASASGQCSPIISPGVPFPRSSAQRRSTSFSVAAAPRIRSRPAPTKSSERGRAGVSAPPGGAREAGRLVPPSVLPVPVRVASSVLPVPAPSNLRRSASRARHPRCGAAVGKASRWAPASS
jgi:hypothetical protein